MKYLLDSDVCIEALRLRRLPDAVLREGPVSAAISVIAYGEVHEGVIYSAQRTLALQRWRAFLSGMTVLGLTIEIAELWADLRGDLGLRGLRLEDNDLIIAATAMHSGLVLMTGNQRHFSRIQGLSVEAPNF
jgi:predicted nucleic acid-binding protein